MKKILLWLAILSLSLGLIACEQTDSQDTTSPVFSGLSEINYVIGEPIPDYRLGVSATDDIDGDLTRWIEIFTDNVDLETPGTYQIIYWIIDDSGNMTEAERTIIVTEAPFVDTVAPELEELKTTHIILGILSLILSLEFMHMTRLMEPSPMKSRLMTLVSYLMS
jgi:hypothetical protein